MKTAIRIFVSSTFKDLDTERDMLVKGVFSKVKSYAESKGLSLYFVDLRWGITTDKSLEIIKECLDEIDHCSPYFIGIVGNRYGYVPEDITGLDLDNLEQYKGKSITEMEITYGVFNRIEKNQSIFAIKKDASDVEMYCSNLADTNEFEIKNTLKKLQALKEKTKIYCQENDIPCYVDYEDVTDMCNFFYQELIKVVDNLVADVGDIEEFKQQNYLTKNLEKVCKNTYMFDYLDQLLEIKENKIVVYGKHFEGKTTFLNHYFSNIENSIIINLAADETLHDINNLYKYLAKKLKLNNSDIKSVNKYLKEYHGDKLYILINDINLINDNDNGDLLLSFPKEISEDIIFIASTNLNDQILSLAIPKYKIAYHKDFDSFDFAEEYMEFICRKYGKDIPDNVKTFLRNTPFTRYSSASKIILNYFIHEKSIDNYSFINNCNNLTDFYSRLIEFKRTKQTYLSYIILLILRRYDLPMDLDMLYDIINLVKEKDREKIYITLNQFTFNKAINDIHSLIEYQNGKIVIANDFVKEALDSNINKNSNAIYRFFSDLVISHLKNRFIGAIYDDIPLSGEELKKHYICFFSYFYNDFDYETEDFYELCETVLHKDVIKFLAKNKCHYWKNYLKLLYSLSSEINLKKGSPIPDSLLTIHIEGIDYTKDELHFLYTTLTSISYYDEAEALATKYGIIIESNNEYFNRSFDLIRHLLCGSELQYAVAVVQNTDFSQFRTIQAKQMLQKSIILFYYLEDKENVKLYFEKYKEISSESDSITMLFEGYLKTDLNAKIPYIQMATKLADIENNAEIEFLAKMERCKLELLNSEIDINRFFKGTNQLIHEYQSLLMNSSHIGYKFYQTICTYCTKYYFLLNDEYKNQFIDILNSINIKNFQAIVKVMAMIASSFLEGRTHKEIAKVNDNFDASEYLDLFACVYKEILGKD